MKDKLARLLPPAVFWLLVWAVAAHVIARELILPSPAAVGRALGGLLVQPEFWRSTAASLLRVAAGFLLGTVAGMALGVATAASRWCDRLFSPAMGAVRTVPVVSFILLLYFCLPTSRVPVWVAALMALPVVWRATRQGIANADPLLLELAGAYRLGFWKRVRLIYAPAALPALAAGWETALGLAWKSGVAAEVLCQPKWAVGSGLQAAKSYLDTAQLLGWTLVIVAVSLVMEGLLKAALRPWKEGGGR